MPSSALICPSTGQLGPLCGKKVQVPETGYRQAVLGEHNMGQSSIPCSSLLGFFSPQLLPGKISAVSHWK